MPRLQAIAKDAQAALDRAEQDVREYMTFIIKNRRALEAENLIAYITIKEILGHNLRKKRQAAAAYFTHIKRWMEYSAEAYRSYEALLISVNRSFKAYNLANGLYHRHTAAFIKKYPELKQKFKRQYKTMKKEMGWV